MTYSTLQYEVDDHIATIMLDRAERLNAVTPAMIDELICAFDRTDSDDDVRVVILTGAGRAFCAGADISAGPAAFRPRAAAEGERPAPPRDGGGLLTLRMYRSLKPIIAAVNGASVGIGATMTLAADIRVASTTARFGFVFARRGIVPEAASAFFLPRIVGISRALQWCFSGRFVSADEALNAGLVTSIHEPDDLLVATRAIAADIVGNASPVSTVVTRHMLWRGLEMSHPMEAHRVDSAMLDALVSSDDAVEGVQSFLEKRDPQFAGNPSSDLPDAFPWWIDPDYRAI